MNESYRKKLIEVALPLEAINRESAREKSIRHGHPSTLHLWWARRPLAACRAVLFASLVDDPSSRPEEFPTEEAQEVERQRLFRIIEELVKWENSNNELVLDAARAEIFKSTDGNPPPVLDPFCGGGSIPLEAQRLGLDTQASDLNPVAVLITKALVEIPPKFAGQPPVNPESRAKLAHGATWKGPQGLAEDVRHYGKWMRDQAFERIGNLYPEATLPGGGEATVIAWLWARSVPCQNPACGARIPVVRSFLLASKAGRKTWIEPHIDRDRKVVRFTVKTDEGGEVPAGTKTRASVRCLFCGDAALTEAKLRELAVVTEAPVGQAYADPDPRIAAPARVEIPGAEQPLSENPRWFSPPAYGMRHFCDLFTHRQAALLTTMSSLVGEVRARIARDAVGAGFPEGPGIEERGTGSAAYADAVSTYLGLAVDRLADRHSTLTRWDPNPSGYAPKVGNTFGRQALPMVWDFPEANPFSSGSGNFGDSVEWVAKVLEKVPADYQAVVAQRDAQELVTGSREVAVATDPPYYDNIGYSDLSDYFYIWLRKSLADVFPNLFSTLLTPKNQELIASPHRFNNDKAAARSFFETGLRAVFQRLGSAQDSDYPLTLFYAFKQAETTGDARTGIRVVSTGWETMLEGLLAAGLGIHGTWPTRSELSNRLVAAGTNALASSIVLVCRPRSTTAGLATRREFIDALRVELPDALRKLQHGDIAPVDLAQAAIGPGMAIFSRYAKVVEADGSAMMVRTALGLINRVLDEILAEQEGDLDADTRFAVAWFEQHGTAEGEYGEADVLARAKNTSVRGLEDAGILVSSRGRVRVLRQDELPEDWDPSGDRRLTVWEVTQHLIRRLERGGESEAAELLRRVGGLGESAHDLAFRLYTICEREEWAQDALGYNALGSSWAEIRRLAADGGPTQGTLGG
jgi:putative DNA methylase